MLGIGVLISRIIHLAKHLQGVRRATKVAVVGVAAFVIVAALAIALFAIPSSYQLGFSAPQAITLKASLNATTLTQNQTIRVTVADQNDLYLANILPLSADWRVQNLSMGPCSDYAYYPFGIAVYQGAYSIDNISTWKPMAFYAPGVYYCPAGRIANSIKFQPRQSISGYVDLSGYWTEGVTIHPGGGASQGVLNPFLPGVYTVVVGDEWGHFQILYFEVRGIGLQEFGLCSSNCGYPSPYLSGFIYFDGSTPVKSLQLIVNGTAQGVQAMTGSTLTRYIEWYKGGFTNPTVVKGDTYVLRFLVTFEDNSMASAATVVVAN